MGICRAPMEDVPFLPVRLFLLPEDSRAWTLQGRRPLPLTVRLVLDSGARLSTFRPRLLRQLRAPALRRIHVHTQLGTGFRKLYELRMEFPESTLASIPRARVVGLDMPRSLAAYDGTIGRDILNRWETLYSGLASSVDHPRLSQHLGLALLVIHFTLCFSTTFSSSSIPSPGSSGTTMSPSTTGKRCLVNVCRKAPCSTQYSK